jgi:hypothetical protein
MACEKLTVKEYLDLKKEKPNVTGSDTIEECQSSCGPCQECPQGKICFWFPPDCGRPPENPCCISGIFDPDEWEAQGGCGWTPFDCTSQSACDSWTQSSNNPPCCAAVPGCLCTFAWVESGHWSLIFTTGETQYCGCGSNADPQFPGTVGETLVVSCAPNDG